MKAGVCFLVASGAIALREVLLAWVVAAHATRLGAVDEYLIRDFQFPALWWLAGVAVAAGLARVWRERK
jgi:hypothetical protein